MTSEELQAIARKYWRADKAYAGSPEHKRLTDLWEQELQKLGQWWALLDELKRDLPGFTLGNATATPDALMDKKRHDRRVFFEPLPAEMQHPASAISRRIEANFHVDALPREVADTHIPLNVEPVEPPNTTLFHALFTSEPASLP